MGVATIVVVRGLGFALGLEMALQVGFSRENIGPFGMGLAIPRAVAQINPSTAILLKSGGARPREEFDASRFTTRTQGARSSPENRRRTRAPESGQDRPPRQGEGDLQKSPGAAGVTGNVNDGANAKEISPSFAKEKNSAPNDASPSSGAPHSATSTNGPHSTAPAATASDALSGNSKVVDPSLGAPAATIADALPAEGGAANDGAAHDQLALQREGETLQGRARTPTEDWKLWLLGLRPEELEEYISKIDPQDPRQNQLELSLATGYFYLDSGSQYGFRRYSVDGALLDVHGAIWFTPFFSIAADFGTSLVAQSPKAFGATPVAMETFKGSLQWRRYTGLSARSASLMFTLGYRDHTLKASSRSTSLLGYKTSGIEVGLDVAKPSSPRVSWQMGGSLLVKPTHKEQANSIGAKSGATDTSTMVELRLGQTLSIDRHHQVFWRLVERVQKHAFRGAVSKVDQRGVVDEDVSVTESSSFFYIGYTFGQ